MRCPKPGGTMGVKAIAFHEVIAADKIHELFGSPESQKVRQVQPSICDRVVCEDRSQKSRICRSPKLDNRG